MHSNCGGSGYLHCLVIRGHQGICESSLQILSKGLISSKAVVTVSQNRTVPVKLLNLGSAPIVLAKGKIIAKFTQLTNDFNVSHVQLDNKVPIVQNINLMPINRGPCPYININAEFLSNFEDNNEPCKVFDVVVENLV
jgi:hypothetical protein